MRLRRRVVVAITLTLLMLMVSGVTAREIIDGDQCSIGTDRIVTGDLFAICGELNIEGHVQGNILGIARTINITGRVDGNIYLAGVEMNVNGAIGRDIHFAGLVLNVGQNSQFEEQGGIISANLSNTVEENISVPGSVINIGYQLIVDGDVGREISFWGSSLNVSGQVDGNIYATVGDSSSDGVSSQIETLLLPFRLDVELIDPGLVVSENGVINGQLDYTAPAPARLDGELADEPIFNNTSIVPIDFTNTEQTARGIQKYLANVFNEFITLFVIGGFGVIFIPRLIQAPLKPMQVRPLSTIGVGLLSFIMSFPIILIIFLISAVIVLSLGFLRLNQIALVGAVVLGLANIGGAGLFYFTAIYISRIIVGLAVGRLVLRLLRRDSTNMRTLFIALAIGLSLVSLAGTVPVVGIGFSALTLFLGLGAILSVLREQILRFGDTQPAASSVVTSPLPYIVNQPTALPYFPEDATRFAPPIIDPTSQPLGTDNLPSGFDWWDQE